MNRDNKFEDEKKDLTLQCVDCENNFLYTAGEQKYFTEKGLYAPKRCHSCRKKIREEKERNNANV